MGTWYAPAGAGQRPCALSQTDGSLQVDPGLRVGVEAGRGQGEDTHLQQGLPDWVFWPFCSSGLCGRGLGPPLAEFLASTEVVLNLGYMLESPGEVLKKKSLDAQTASRTSYIRILERRGGTQCWYF